MANFRCYCRHCHIAYSMVFRQLFSSAEHKIKIFLLILAKIKECFFFFFACSIDRNEILTFTFLSHYDRCFCVFSIVDIKYIQLSFLLQLLPSHYHRLLFSFFQREHIEYLNKYKIENNKYS